MKREQFILDPGIGFGKTLEQNVEIIRRLQEFETFNLPLHVGASRKGHLGTLLQQRLGLANIPGVTERLEASLAETAVAVLNGASIVRTHDVLPTVKFVVVLDAIKNDEERRTCSVNPNSVILSAHCVILSAHCVILSVAKDLET